MQFDKKSLSISIRIEWHRIASNRIETDAIRFGARLMGMLGDGGLRPLIFQSVFATQILGDKVFDIVVKVVAKVCAKVCETVCAKVCAKVGPQ